MKKRISLLLYLVVLVTVLISFNFLSMAFAGIATESHEVTIDGKPVQFNDDMGRPWMSSLDRTMVPLRIVSENMGYDATWNQSTKTATIKNGTDTLQVVIGKNTAIKNGKTINIDTQDGKPVDTKAQLVNDRTFVPIRFISEAMGATVGYNRVQSGSVVIHQITITTKKVTSPVGSDATFNPKTDVMPDGRLTKAKTTEYIEKMIDGTALVKDGGKYYLKFDRPAIADGYVTTIGFDNILKAGGGYTLNTGRAILPQNVLPGNQSFEKELDPAQLVDSKYYKFTLSVMTQDERFSTAYYVWYYPDKGLCEYMYLNELGDKVEYKPFEMNRLFEGF